MVTLLAGSIRDYFLLSLGDVKSLVTIELVSDDRDLEAEEELLLPLLLSSTI
jgi:hypothetical protein